MIIDLFAGMGGWEEGLRLVGRRDVIGVEIDETAVATRFAAGHATWQTDVSTVSDRQLSMIETEGLVASLPCQGFSAAGQRRGIQDRELLRQVAVACRDGWVSPDCEGGDERSPLILEPLRWAWYTKPTWVVLEQVRAVRPVWETFAETLQEWGFNTWTGVLCAADFGVPQVRHRAFLLANRAAPVTPPEPTHSQNGVPRWVTMGEALGWPPSTRINTGCDWKPSGRREEAQTVDASRPAPTVTTKTGKQWRIDWVWERSATTVACDPRIFRPGPHAGSNRQQPCPGRSEGAVKVSAQEALILQSFHPAYPVQGNKTRQFEQIGNAVPPLLAKAVFKAVLSPLGSSN